MTGIFAYLNKTNHPNVGKFTMVDAIMMVKIMETPIKNS